MRAKALALSQHRFPIPEVADFCAAPWLVLRPLLTTVRCIPHDVDRYGRDIATCWLGEVNLNETMVAEGQAVAYRKYSKKYVGAEGLAEAAELGLWSTEFEMPWDYRRAH